MLKLFSKKKNTGCPVDPAMKFFITILFISMVLAGCSSKRQSPAVPREDREEMVRTAVNELSYGNTIGDHIGITGSTQLFDQYQQLNKYATTEELIGLTDHPAAALRYYSFRALASRCEPRVYDILLKHIYDTAEVTHLDGCIGMREPLSGNLVRLVRFNDTDPKSYKLDAIQAKTIDSLLKRIHPGPFRYIF